MLEYVLKPSRNVSKKLCLMVQRQETWLSIQKESKTRPEMTSSWPASPELIENGPKHEDLKFSYLIASKTASIVMLTCLGILEFIVFYLKLLVVIRVLGAPSNSTRYRSFFLPTQIRFVTTRYSGHYSRVTRSYFWPPKTLNRSWRKKILF